MTRHDDGRLVDQYTEPDRGNLIPRGSIARRGGTREQRSSSPDGTGNCPGLVPCSPVPRVFGHCAATIASVPAPLLSAPSISSDPSYAEVHIVEPTHTITLDALTRTQQGGRGAAAEVRSCRPLATSTEAWCSMCGNAALTADGTPRLWRRLEQAIAELTGPVWGWQARSAELVCASCLLGEQCQRGGHQWSKWKPLAWFGGDPGDVIRFCDVCVTNETARLER